MVLVAHVTVWKAAKVNQVIQEKLVNIRFFLFFLNIYSNSMIQLGTPGQRGVPGTKGDRGDIGPQGYPGGVGSAGAPVS